MPLYTYMVSYQGSTHIAQGKHSNFKGFVSSWSSNIPLGALPALTPTRQKELAAKAYSGDFQPVQNTKNVWQKSIDIGGNELIVIAIQTQI